MCLCGANENRSMRETYRGSVAHVFVYRGACGRARLVADTDADNLRIDVKCASPRQTVSQNSRWADTRSLRSQRDIKKRILSTIEVKKSKTRRITSLSPTLNSNCNTFKENERNTIPMKKPKRFKTITS